MGLFFSSDGVDGVVLVRMVRRVWDMYGVEVVVMLGCGMVMVISAVVLL